MISKEEAARLAKLARLELTEKETGKMQKDLTAILDYFAILKKAPKARAVKAQKIAENGLRIDKAMDRPASLANNLVQAAPDKKDGYVKVKAIL